MSTELRYLDSSALVKLVIAEAESGALRAHLRAGSARATCGLAHVEVIRAVRLFGESAVGRARRLLSEADIVPVDDALLSAAADLEDDRLRSLDAIHVAAALSLEGDLTELITYDRRMAAVAGGLGIPVSSPA